MKQLTPLQLRLFQVGGILLLIGAVLPLTAWSFAAPFVFALGALLFAPLQMLMRYEGTQLTLRRLRRQQVTAAGLLLVAAGILLFEHFRLSPFEQGLWKFPLIVAAIMELYTAFRIPHELEKES